MKVDVLIVGSGFAASVLAKKFEEARVQHIIIDVSEEICVEYINNNEEFFDPIQAAKTSKKNGGIGVWGNSVTIPSPKNFFEKGDDVWLNLNSALDPRDLQRFLPALSIKSSQIPKNTSKILKRIMPDFDEVFITEVHGYAKAPSDSNGFKSALKEVHQGRIVEIEPMLKQIRFSPNSGDAYTIQYEIIVFASGAIGNALLVNRFTGANRFFLGNHISTEIGCFSLNYPTHLWNVYQSFSRNERQFVTFSLKEQKEEGATSGAIRLIPSRKELLSLKWRVLCVAARTRFLQAAFWSEFGLILRDSLSRIFLARRLDLSFRLRLIADLPFSKSNGWLEICNQSESWAQIRINLVLTDEYKKGLSNLIEAFVRISESPNSGFRIKRSTNLSLDKAVWSDCGHYYGTVPVSLDGEYPTVDEDLSLRCGENMYVVGNSSHANGSHGHPTALTILLASRLANHLVEKIHA